MGERFSYSIDSATASADLTLENGRFAAETCGKGLADRPKRIDIALADLTQFCLAPIVGAQRIVSRDNPTVNFDSEFIFSYRADDRVRQKRVFVDSDDPRFAALLDRLREARPDASLLHLDPQAAQKRMGAPSASTTVKVIMGLLIGVPVIIALIVMATR